MAFEFNPQQKELIKGGLDWYRNSSKQVLDVSGQAGTGKTTVIRHLTEALGLTDDEVMYAAFVGRAAQNLALSGLNAKTIHTSFYELVDVQKNDEEGNPMYKNGRPITVKRFRLKKSLPSSVKLIVIDEAGTVNEDMANDIKSFGIPIIALGDLEQLKPVFGRAGFLHNPDYVLTEIMRQAEDSEIIYLAHKILRGEKIETGRYNNSEVLYMSDLTDQHMLEADMMLTIRNKTRDKVNDHMREILGYNRKRRGSDEIPIVLGEKVVSRRNNWKEYLQWDGNDLYLTNGMVGTVEGIHTSTYDGNTVAIDFKPDFVNNDYYRKIRMDLDYIKTPSGEKYENYPMGNLFQYGYSISTYMAQGSQYIHPLYFSENIMPTARRTHDYVGITRARQTITLVLPDPVPMWSGRRF